VTTLVAVLHDSVVILVFVLILTRTVNLLRRKIPTETTPTTTGCSCVLFPRVTRLLRRCEGSNVGYSRSSAGRRRH